MCMSEKVALSRVQVEVWIVLVNPPVPKQGLAHINTMGKLRAANCLYNERILQDAFLLEACVGHAVI